MSPSSLARLAIVGATLGLSGAAYAYPLNPWGTATPKSTFVLNPFLYAYPGPDILLIPYGLYGFTDQVDLIGGLYVEYADGVSFGGVELLPRYFFADNMGVALHIIAGGGAVTVGPEFHGVFGGDSLALTVNAGWLPVIGLGNSAGFSPGAVKALIAPEYNFSSQLSVFLEVDPTLTLGEGGGLGLVVVPGVGFATDEDQTNTFSVGLQVDNPQSKAVSSFAKEKLSLGLWYSRAFGGE